jgi:hypothetical protein
VEKKKYIKMMMMVVVVVVVVHVVVGMDEVNKGKKKGYKLHREKIKEMDMVVKVILMLSVGM